MAVGGMTKGQARRQSKLKAKRAARRAQDVVGINKAKHVAQAKRAEVKHEAKWNSRAANRKPMRGHARAMRRGNLKAVAA